MKSKTKNSKAKVQYSTKDNEMFRNISFCFPQVDIGLTAAEVQMLSKQIQSQKGTIVQFSDHLNQKPIEYVLANPKTKLSLLQEKIKNKLNYIDILDYNYVQSCISSEKLLQAEKFSLLKDEDQQVKPDLISSGQKKRKPNQEQTQKKQIQQKQDKQIQHQKPQKLNKFIEQELLQLQKIYANQRDIGRKVAYGKAASIIKTHKQDIATESDVDRIEGLGPKIRDKVKQIIATGKIKKLQQLNQSQQVVAMSQLSKVWGIGPAKAKQLYKSGIKQIQQLRKNQSSLTHNQKIGLKYLQDFQQKIPRSKVTKMFNFVRTVLTQISKNPQVYHTQVCGSYRRGKQFCGDMDIIIARKDGVFENDLLIKLVAELKNRTFLTDSLSQPEQGSGSYMGVCRFQSGIHHRIDIKHYPLDQYAFALLYFTGSGMFNRALRIKALQIGLTLSDKGFAKNPINKKGVIWNKPAPSCFTQEDILAVLGMKYKTPQERDQ